MLKITSCSACCTWQNSWHILTHPTSDKTTICYYFNHMIHPCWTLSAAGSFPSPPSLSLSLFSPYIKRWVALSPHAAISRVESPPDTLAYLSSAAQTSKSARASHRDGEVPPGSRRRLQSTRCSPGMKYPFRYEERGEAISRIQFIYLQWWWCL